MVAREHEDDPPRRARAPHWLGGLLLAWRRLLSRPVGWFATLAARLGDRASRDDRPLLERRWLLGAAVGALAVGVVGGIALAPGGQPRVVAAAAGAGSVLWAVVRLALMRVTARGSESDARAITGAWALGMLAYAVGVTPSLRALAWAASAALTWYALWRLGEERRTATRMVAVAWGAQAVVVVLSWLASGAYVAFLATRN